MNGRKMLAGLALATALAAWLTRDSQPAPAPAPPAAAPEPLPVPQPEPARHTGFARRAATALAFVVLFCAGGAIAAGAGNQLASSAAVVDADSTDPVTTDATTTDVSTETTTDPATATDPAATTEADPSDAAPVQSAPVPPTPGAATTTHAQVATAPLAPAHTTLAHRAQEPTAPTPAASPFPLVPFDAHAWLTEHPGSPLGDAAVALAEHYLGVPYRWGGNQPGSGFDCSGLTQYVYAQLGVWLPHYAAAQFLAYPRLDPSQLQPGDLVFFEPKADGPGHVAIYAGDGAIVEAPHTGATVRIGSLAGAAASMGFLGAVRPTATGGVPFQQVFAYTPPPPRIVSSHRVAD